MSDPMVEWLTGVLDEIERVARGACQTETVEHWRWEYTGGHRGEVGDGVTDTVVDLDACAGFEFVDEGGNGSPIGLRSAELVEPFLGQDAELQHLVLNEVEECTVMVARHIALHDPAAVLADVAAKRALIELHRPRSHFASSRKLTWDQQESGQHDPDYYYCECQTDDGALDGHYPCETVQALASAYASWPGYREEWRP